MGDGVDGYGADTNRENSNHPRTHYDRELKMPPWLGVCVCVCVCVCVYVRVRE